MLFEIRATRNDGMECGGTVDVPSVARAIRECRRTFKPFIAKRSGIYCPTHVGGAKACYLHTGETFTFSNFRVVQLSESFKEVAEYAA